MDQTLWGHIHWNSYDWHMQYCKRRHLMKRIVREEARRSLGFRLTRWTTLFFYYSEVNFSLQPLVACFSPQQWQRNRKKSSNYSQREDDGGERRETEKELLRFTDGKSFVSSSITPELLETESISILQSGGFWISVGYCFVSWGLLHRKETKVRASK